jgi:PhnB protein
MQVSPSLSFRGECETAFRFYEHILGGAIVTLLTYGMSPLAPQVPEDWRGKILHATLAVGDYYVMGTDAPPDQYRPPQGFALLIDADEPADADRLFDALADRGTIKVPMQKTFWASRFGLLVDRFGIPWEIYSE